ncbi:MAG TPA: STAS domain-containing protein [Limnobacter sp.]|nr:STAS domain-containing protein [Limnobacter sp.]
MQDLAIQQSTTLVLHALNIVEAAHNLDRINHALREQMHVLIDLSQCEDVDTAGLQMLAAIRLDPAVCEKIQWSSPSPAFVEKANRLGLATLLLATNGCKQ